MRTQSPSPRRRPPQRTPSRLPRLHEAEAGALQQQSSALREHLLHEAASGRLVGTSLDDGDLVADRRVRPPGHPDEAHPPAPGFATGAAAKTPAPSAPATPARQ